MAKTGDSIVRMSRKGMMVWIGLMLFVAAWMFVLGILVGRGMAPVNLDAGKLEQELAELKSKVLRQEQSKVDAQASGTSGQAPELGFYEALKNPKARKPVLPPPTPRVKPAPRPVAKPVPVPKPAPPVKPAPKPKPKPKPAAEDPKPAQSGRFTVQVAAVKDTNSAARLVSELRKKGYRAYQVRTDLTGNVWFRVRVGAFTERGAAEKMVSKLKADKYGAMVLSTK